MSKKIMLLLSLLLIITETFAQTPMSGQNILPQIGDEITVFYLDTTGINIEGTGPSNQKIWNFSEVNDLSSVAPTTTFFSDPVGSEYYEDNPQSNILITHNNKPDTIYASVTSNSFSYKSQYDTVFFVNYENDSILHYSFPLSIGNSYTCNFTGAGILYSSNSELLINNGLVESEVDSYGTLIIPDGSTIENVYRVKLNYSMESAVIIFGEEIALPSTIAEIFYWFNEDYIGPIMTYTKDYSVYSEHTSFCFQSKIYLGKDKIITDEQSHLNIDIFPNPAQNYLELNNITDNTVVEIYDIQGNPVYNSRLNKNKIFVGNFQSGLYLIVAKNQDKIIGVEKFMKY